MFGRTRTIEAPPELADIGDGRVAAFSILPGVPLPSSVLGHEPEAPVLEAPVLEAPVLEAPVLEAPVLEAPAAPVAEMTEPTYVPLGAATPPPAPPVQPVALPVAAVPPPPAYAPPVAAVPPPPIADEDPLFHTVPQSMLVAARPVSHHAAADPTTTVVVADTAPRRTFLDVLRRRTQGAAAAPSLAAPQSPPDPAFTPPVDPPSAPAPPPYAGSSDATAVPAFAHLVPQQQVAGPDAVQPVPPAPAPANVGLVFADGSHQDLGSSPESAALQHVANVLAGEPGNGSNGPAAPTG